MNFAAILAGGTGKRMGISDKPKQFLDLCGKPIIIHTIEKILSVSEFDFVVVAIHPDYKNYFLDMLADYSLNTTNKIIIVNGGKERIDSIQNTVNAITNLNSNDDDVVVICDAVRPFVSQAILKESISTAREYGACVAVVPAVDTMYKLDNDGYITECPNRSVLFNGQAPDSFRVSLLKKSLDNLSETDKLNITGTVQICMLNNHKIKTIQGDYKNIKITTLNDLKIAEGFIKNEGVCINK